MGPTLLGLAAIASLLQLKRNLPACRVTSYHKARSFHTGYLALAIAAWGLAVMWPRFLTLTLFAVMLFLYYLLAWDEERRMLNQFGESYQAYMARTEMFVPRAVERALGRRDQLQPQLTIKRAVGIPLVLLGLCLGSGFGLRAFTTRHLPLKQIADIDAIAITTEDLSAAEELIPSVLV